MSRRIPFFASLLALVLTLIGLSTTNANAGTFRVENNGDHTIIGIWVTPEYIDSWGEERLGEDVLDPGYYVSEYVSGCYADIRVLYDDRQVTTKYNFDTCVYNLESYY